MRIKSTAHADDKTRPLRPGWVRSRAAKWPKLLYRLGLGSFLARQVMILTTRGRVTGRARQTPLWYVREGDIIYCFSGWGPSSDWYKNLVADPEVLIQVGNKSWPTRGVFIQELPERERLLHRFSDKYGRLLPVFYHLDHLVLVAFPYVQPEKGARKDA